MSDEQILNRLATLIDQMSIWGRLAFGITCLERLCAAWSANQGEGIRKVLSQFWSFWLFSKERRLDLWEEACDALLPEDFHEMPSLTGNLSLSWSQQMVLHAVIENVWLIGSGNLYGGFRSEFTREPTIKVISLLQNHGIELPDVQLFLKSPVSESNGWGEPHPPDYFRG